ncbi:MAG: VCBS repeat-containing protein [Planctomycetes bacterium]|nr:VCBS repeat-containing protein [Planctomycetota bacterium]
MTRSPAIPRALAVFAAAAAFLAGPRAQSATSFAPPGRIAAHRAVDLDADGRAELLLVSPTGELSVLVASDGASFAHRPTGLVLARPRHAALACADLDGDGPLELVVFDDRGVHVHRLGEGFAFATEPLTVTTAPRLRIRLGRPTFAELVQDLNGDGRPDLVLPVAEACEVWLASAEGGAAAIAFELAQTIPLALSHSVSADGTHLAEAWSNELRVPQLDVSDVNGDGRPDLRAREGKKRRFFLQDAAGRFAEKPIEVDLALFRDTTPEAEVATGSTLVVGDDQQMQDGDLDGDGIPDYVIAHRRKVWSFLAGKDGPQFKKADVRIVAEDVTGLLLLRLDEDARVDLCIFKLEVPSAVALVLGIVSSIDIPIRVLGYRTDEKGSFARKAQWSRELTLRIPSILKLLGQANDLVERFTKVLSKLRWSTLGDADADGTADLALVTEDEAAIELWRSPPAAGDADGATDQRWKSLFFDDPDTVFDVERLLKLAAQIFDARTGTLTGSRAADARRELPAGTGTRIVGILAADLDGDRRQETLVVRESETAPGELRFDVVRW